MKDLISPRSQTRGKRIESALLLVLCASCASCASAAPAEEEIPRPRASGGDAASSVTMPHPSAVPSVAASSSARHETPRTRPCQKLALADACIRPPVFEPVDPSAFFRREGAKAPPAETDFGCREFAIGKSSLPALHCLRGRQESTGAAGSQTHTYRSSVYDVIYVVKAKVATEVFEQLSRFDVFDKEDPEEGPLFALMIDVQDGGEVLRVEEPAPGACADAIARAAGELLAAAKESAGLPSRLAWARADERLLRRMCQRTGNYRWDGSRFVPEVKAQQRSLGSD